MPLRAGVLVGDDAGAARGGEPLLGPAVAPCFKEGSRDQTEVYSLSTALYTGEGGPGATQRFHN